MKLDELLDLTIKSQDALEAGDPMRALSLFRDKHKLVEQIFGSRSASAATSRLDIARVLLSLHKPQEAKPLLIESIEIYQSLGLNDQRLLLARSAYAMTAYLSAQYHDAEVAYLKVISELERLGPQYAVQLAQERDHLAQVYVRQQRYDEAEDLLKQALSTFHEEDANSPDTATCLSMLATVFKFTQRLREAEAALRRALQIYESVVGPDSVHLAPVLDHLGGVLVMRANTEHSQSLADEAVALGERALSLFTRYLPAGHISILRCTKNLAHYRDVQATVDVWPPGASRTASGSTTDSAAAARDPNLKQEILSAMHPEVLIERMKRAEATEDIEHGLHLAEATLADCCRAFGPSSDLALYCRTRILAIARRAVGGFVGDPRTARGTMHPYVFVMYQLSLHMGRGRVTEEGPPDRNLLGDSGQLITKLVHLGLRTGAEIIHGVQTEEAMLRATLRRQQTSTAVGAIDDYLELLCVARRLGAIDMSQAFSLAVEAIQLSHLSGASLSLSSSIERQRRSGTQLGLLLEHRHNVVVELARLEEQLVDEALGSFTPATTDHHERAAHLRQLRGKIAELTAQIRSLEVLDQSIPYFAQVERIENLLRDDQGVVAYFVGHSAIFVIMISRTTRTFKRIEYEDGLLSIMCKRMWASASLDGVSTVEQLPRFDFFNAHELYKLLIAPLEKHLESVTDLLIVPHGPLWNVPFGALLRDVEGIKWAADQHISETPERSSGNPLSLAVDRLYRGGADPLGPYRAASSAEAWLADRFATSILPSIGALQWHRVVSQSSDSHVGPFIGFGDPHLASAIDGIVASGNPVVTLGGTFARPHRLSRIPETALLLDLLADVLGGDPLRDVLTGSSATKPRVLELSRSGELATRRVICFATHSVMLERAHGLAEAGLLLSETDGHVATAASSVLTASEIAQLRFNADWVLLAACFTAAPSGRVTNDPLSGLARAFFVAGARSLLVSMWPVDVHATEALIRRLFSAEYKHNTRSSALQQAMSYLRNDGSRPHFSHPAFWCAFSIIGDASSIMADVVA